MDRPGYFVYEFVDETSMYDTDPSVRFNYGIECYERIYKKMGKNYVKRCFVCKYYSPVLDCCHPKFFLNKKTFATEWCNDMGKCRYFRRSWWKTLFKDF